MEQKKAKRGRPRIDTHITENGAPSRRQAVNAMYMFAVAATEIPDSNLLWFSDDKTMTVRGKNGILEQIGRMLVQDRLSEDDCIYVANLAIAALKKWEDFKRN